MFLIQVRLQRSRVEAKTRFRQMEPDPEIASIPSGALTFLADIKDRIQSFVERDVGEPEHCVGHKVEIVLDHLDHDPV